LTAGASLWSISRQGPTGIGDGIVKVSTVALDCGTTMLKAGVFDLRGRALATAHRSAPPLVRDGVRVEQDLEQMVRRGCDAVREALERSGRRAASVAAVCVTGQRATLQCLDGRGRPLGRAISWLDGRAVAQARALRRKLSERDFQAITGLPMDPVFTMARLMWLRGQDRERWRLAARFALAHDYVLARLGADQLATDWSNASLTGLFDIRRRRWSDRILGLLRLDEPRLPALVPSGTAVGRLSARAARATGLRAGTLLVAGGGDQQCAGLGAGAVVPGVVEITFGTAAVPLRALERPLLDPSKALMCCAHASPELWELEGFQNSAGAALDWARRLTGAEGCSAAALDRLLASCAPGASGVLFFPFLAGGASAPHWNPQATAALLGLRAGHDRAVLLRAVVEGVMFEARWILEAMDELAGPATELRVTGGCTRLRQWARVLADACGRPVSTLRHPDAALSGAAMLAAVGAGAFGSAREAAHAMTLVGDTVEPDRDRHAVYEAAYRRYRDVHERFEAARVFGTLAHAGRGQGAA
jgi:xylulokinase